MSYSITQTRLFQVCVGGKSEGEITRKGKKKFQLIFLDLNPYLRPYTPLRVGEVFGVSRLRIRDEHA